MDGHLLDSGASDDALLAELGRRLARERLQRDLSQALLAQEAGVSLSTLRRLEAGQGCHLSALLRVLRALGLLGNLDALIPEAPPSPLQAVERRGRQRQRASPRRDPGDDAPADSSWTWGDDQ